MEPRQSHPKVALQTSSDGTGMKPDAESGKKRIFVVDDHPLVREWLATLINQQSDLKICGEAANQADALKLLGSAKPHVAIVDISMEGGSGIELIEKIKAACPEVVVIVLSMHDEMMYAEQALRAGARGYVMKREATKNVLQAIRCVLDGELYLIHKLAGMLAEKFVENDPPAPGILVGLLSNRELEVFHLLGRGWGTRQIAEELRVSFGTVQSFRARIKEKLKFATGNELLREAMRWHDSH
jgi:DNA-binding NarL/FixJ family response regulator